jgi:hypothetical protein
MFSTASRNAQCYAHTGATDFSPVCDNRARPLDAKVSAGLVDKWRLHTDVSQLPRCGGCARDALAPIQSHRVEQVYGNYALTSEPATSQTFMLPRPLLEFVSIPPSAIFTRSLKNLSLTIPEIICKNPVTFFLDTLYSIINSLSGLQVSHSKLCCLSYS